MPPIVSTDWRRCIFPPNQLFLYFTTTKVIEKASNYKVLFNNVYRLAAAPLNCCKLRATHLEAAEKCPDARRVAPIRAQFTGVTVLPMASNPFLTCQSDRKRKL